MPEDKDKPGFMFDPELDRELDHYARANRLHSIDRVQTPAEQVLNYHIEWKVIAEHDHKPVRQIRPTSIREILGHLIPEFLEGKEQEMLIGDLQDLLGAISSFGEPQSPKVREINNRILSDAIHWLGKPLSALYKLSSYASDEISRMEFLPPGSTFGQLTQFENIEHAVYLIGIKTEEFIGPHLNPPGKAQQK